MLEMLLEDLKRAGRILNSSKGEQKTMNRFKVWWNKPHGFHVPLSLKWWDGSRRNLIDNRGYVLNPGYVRKWGTIYTRVRSDTGKRETFLDAYVGPV